MSDVNNNRIDSESFQLERLHLFSEQLASEPYDLEEAFSFGRANAERGTVSSVLQAAKDSGETCVVPRAGVAHMEGQKALLGALAEAGAGILPITIDSLTRNLRFEEAAKGLESSTANNSTLNGFPIVAHGIEATRGLISSFDRPVMVRANAIDLRLVAETGFASGATGFVSGPMYATLEYSKTTKLEESIPRWQYVFRLMAAYTEAGIPIADDAIGFSQSGTCSVPSLMHVGVVLDALIMAGQGVKHIMPYQMLQGHIAQDVAGCFAVETLTKEYLARLGFTDVHTYVASSDWNGAFPTRRPDAYGLLATNVFAAGIARAPLNYVKTIDEGIGVPTAEANADSIRITRYLLQQIARQSESLIGEEVEAELALNLLEARAILDAVLDLGDGDPVVGAIKALPLGILDIPFSPNIHVRGDVLPVRDHHGAVRFLDAGALPIPAEARRIEKERLSQRSAARSLTYEDVIQDLSFLELSEISLTTSLEGADLNA